MTGKILFYFILDTIFVANIILLLQLLQKNQVATVKQRKLTEQMVIPESNKEIFLKFMEVYTGSADIIDKIEWEHYYDESSGNNPDIPLKQIIAIRFKQVKERQL